ncbi:MAG TPA: MASE1 domain-containing protein, partial [Humisphaera sp.]|nr:MASE1 domain-containing protein [Humisphaera sp.]
MNRQVRTTAAILLVAALYFVGGKVGLKLWSVNPSSTAVWPPTGIALAAVLLLGPRVAPGIFIAAFLVNLDIPNATVATSVGIAIGNTLEALAAAWAVKRFAHGVKAFDRVRDVYKYMLVAAVLATMVSATIGVSVLCVGKLEQWSNFYHVWIVWWLGDCVSAIVIAPLLLVWATRPPPHVSVERIVEAACLLASLCVIFIGVFGGWSEAVGNEYPLEYAGIPVLLWAALRFQQRGAVTAAAI